MAISKQLLDYIEKEEGLGKSKKEIKKILISAGWHKDAISEAFDTYYSKEDTKDNVPRPEEPLKDIEDEEQTEKSSSRDEMVRDIVTPPPNPGRVYRKRRVRPALLYVLFFVIGMGLMEIGAYFFYGYSQSVEQKVEKDILEASKQEKDNEGNIAEALAIQKELEQYYKKNKNYPQSLYLLSNSSEVTFGLGYVYTPQGSPPQSYTLTLKTDTEEDGNFSIKNGLLTLKNKQGNK